MNSFKQINTTDFDLQQVQDNVRTFVQQFVNCPLMTSQLISGISLSSGNNTVSHKLGRAYQGWIPVSISAAVTLYEVFPSTLTNPQVTKTIVLNSSGAATVSLWVF